MSKQCYVEKSFSTDSLHLIQSLDLIIKDYVRQGYRLTVRQLYYQLVARAIVPNTERSYKKITSLVNDAKLAGLLDWDAIEDRTREFITRPSWSSGSQILRSAAQSFHYDMWQRQDYRVFVIVEKEALVGVLSDLCYEYDVPLLAARGYPSGTVLREFAHQHIIPAYEDGKTPLVLHLGDHDPSGIDMSRDLEDRIYMLADSTDIYFKRIALNWDQIQDQKPPPNPAKSTDSRFGSYRSKYGSESWELDALSPSYLNQLLTAHITDVIDQERWNETLEAIADVKKRIQVVAESF